MCQSGYTVLGVAVQKNNIPLLRILLADRRIDPNAPFSIGGIIGPVRPLFHATLKSSVTAVRILLGHSRIDANTFSNGVAPIHMAAMGEDPATLKEFLLQRGVDVNIHSEDHGGITPLHAAVLRQRAKSVRMLLAHPRVDPNMCDKVRSRQA